MEWQELEGGFARRFPLNDGTHIVGVVRMAGEEAETEFFADCAEVADVESQSEKMGGLSDFIDELQPRDVIDIYSRIDKSSKAM